MKNRLTVVLRYQNLADLRKKLQALGVAVHAEAEADRIEGHFERCNGPELITATGTVISVLASPEAADLMREVMPPEVLVDFIEGETEDVEVDGEMTTQPVPWPEYTVMVEGEKGVVATKQGPGRFQI